MSDPTTYAPTGAHDVPSTAAVAVLVVAATVALVFAAGAPTTAATVVATSLAVTVARRIRTATDARTNRRRVPTETPA